jgi:hypothetical protein
MTLTKPLRNRGGRFLQAMSGELAENRLWLIGI